MKKIIKLCSLFIIILLFPLVVNAKDNKVTLYLFHGDGCPHCAAEIEYLNSIEKKYDNLEIVKYEVWYNEDNSKFLQEVYEAYGVTRNGVPTTVIGNTIMQGYGTSTGSKIERAIQYYLENDYTDQIARIKEGTFNKEDLENGFEEEEKKSDEEMTIEVPALGKVNLKRVSLTSAAVVIGLVDGFNPCAMWILLFLISVLIGMKNKKKNVGFRFNILSYFGFSLYANNVILDTNSC